MKMNVMKNYFMKYKICAFLLCHNVVHNFIVCLHLQVNACEDYEDYEENPYLNTYLENNDLNWNNEIQLKTKKVAIPLLKKYCLIFLINKTKNDINISKE